MSNQTVISSLQKFVDLEKAAATAADNASMGRRSAIDGLNPILEKRWADALTLAVYPLSFDGLFVSGLYVEMRRPTLVLEVITPRDPVTGQEIPGEFYQAGAEPNADGLAALLATELGLADNWVIKIRLPSRCLYVAANS